MAQVLGGRTTRGSGCGADKGDVEVRGVGGRSGYLLEAKGTKHASLSVKQVWLRKITREALAKGLMPALQMEIRGDRTADTPALWVAVPLAEFHRLLEAAGSSVEENDDCDGG